jgi:Flp pilus assembly pilin Flp
MKSIWQFCRDDRGQDLVEYTLLMAFVALASGTLFLAAGGNISNIWSVTNNQLAQANAAALGN